MVAQTVYDPDPSAAWGTVVDSVNNAGHVTRTTTDLAGRTVETDQDYVTGQPGAFGTSDIITRYFFDNFGRLATMRSENNTTSFDPNNPDKGTSAGTVNEDTRYVYGCPYDGSLQTAVVYPDSTDSVRQDANADWVIDSGSGPHLGHLQLARPDAHRHRPTGRRARVYLRFGRQARGRLRCESGAGGPER